MKKTKSLPKFAVGQVVYVVDTADCVRNNTVVRIPMGTPVTVQAVSVLKTKASRAVFAAEVRYNCPLPGVPVCWIDEDRLSSLVVDVAA